MTTQTKGDLHITGAHKASGGVYDTIRISGAGDITGDMEAREVHIAGAGNMSGNVEAGEVHILGVSNVKGRVKAQNIQVMGMLKVTGDVETQKLDVAGACEFGGKIEAHDVRFAGMVKARGAVHAKEVDVPGVCTFGGDVEADRFHSTGVIQVKGLLSADMVEIYLGTDCGIGEIGGEKIRVVGPEAAAVGLNTQSIEGDDIYLEVTRAKVVRGRRVTIGPGCRIDEVEYSESLHIDPAAKVGKQTYAGGQTPPPPVDDGPAQPPDGMARPRGSSRYVNLGLCGLPWSAWKSNWGVNTCGGKACGGKFRNPVARFLLGILGCGIAALVVFIVLATVLPTVALVLFVVLGGVGLLLLGLAVGIPVFIFFAVAWKLLLLPFHIIRRIIMPWSPWMHA